MSKKAIFLDLDGVIVYDPGLLHKKEQVKFLPGVEALRKLEDRGFILVIVSNKSVVARGLLSEKDLLEIDSFIRGKLRGFGVNIGASYYCPHHPDFTGPCSCRKPKSGLFVRAIKELDIDPAFSVIIGDKLSDLVAAEKVGVGLRILVKRNGEFWEATDKKLRQVKFKANNLSEAIKIIP